MTSLMSKLKKNSTLKDNTYVLSESPVYEEPKFVDTGVPMMNVALSGSLTGGLVPGVTTIAGPSRHFKSMFALLMAKGFLEEHPEGALIFYDSEHGSPKGYFENFGIDPDRVLYIQIKDIEELKFNLMNQLKELTKSDDVMIIVDSLGNLASKKEVDDALDEKSVADMTRAKAFKSLFRMITPYIKEFEVPFVNINHTYDSIGLYPTKIVSGGTGIVYSSDTVWIVGRRQNKVGTEIMGYDFIINVDKSRFVKEKSLIPITVTFEGGVQQSSGLLDAALAGDFVVRSGAWYQRINSSTGEAIGKKFQRKDTIPLEFWDEFFADDKFVNFIENYYKLGGKVTATQEIVSEEELEA